MTDFGLDVQFLLPIDFRKRNERETHCRSHFVFRSLS